MEKNFLDGLYCFKCREKYDCGGDFDSNSTVLLLQLQRLIPHIEIISLGKGIVGSANPWSKWMVKPDIVGHYSDNLIVVVEADDYDGHSKSRGNKIDKWGTPWQYERDLLAERAKMMTCTKALYSTYRKSVVFIRCNSDNRSDRIPDIGLVRRAQMVVDKIQDAQSSVGSWPADSFRVAFCDMPSQRIQDGLKIADIFLRWNDMPQTLVATSESDRKAITKKETEEKNARRAGRK